MQWSCKYISFAFTCILCKKAEICKICKHNMHTQKYKNMFKLPHFVGVQSATAAPVTTRDDYFSQADGPASRWTITLFSGCLTR